MSVLKPPELDRADRLSVPRDWLRPAVPLTFIMLADTLMSRAGVLVLGLRGDVVEAGIYAVAFSLALLTSMPRMAIASLFAPTVSTLHARGDTDALQQLIARSALLSLAGTLAVALPLIIGAPILLAWYGPTFGAAAPILVILIAGHLAAAAAGPQQHLLTMTGHERQGAVLMGAAAAGAFAGGALLAIPYGPAGVAAAAAISMTGWNVAMAIFVWRRLGLRPGLACLRLPARRPARSLTAGGPR